MSDLRSYWTTRSVRFQVAAIIASVCVILTLVNVLLLSTFLRQYALESSGAALEQEASALTQCSSGSVVVQMYTGQPGIDTVMEAVLGSTETRHALLLDTAGHLRYETPMPSALRAVLLADVRRDLLLHHLSNPAEPTWHTVGSETVVDVSVACRDVSLSGAPTSRVEVRGGLLLAEDQQVAQNAWGRMVVRVLIAGLLATSVAVIAGILASAVLTRSIRAVTWTARRIAGGDFRRRVSPHGPSEINEMSVAFNQMVEEVVRQRQVERDLLANISHELASPLGLIRGYADALADRIIVSDTERASALYAIVRETARLQRLTGDLLDLALLETGQVSVHPEEVPVSELLTGLQERLSPLMREAGVTSSVVVSPDLPAITTDGQRLEQILVNLLNNAVHHTPPGGSIVTTAAPEGDGIVISIRDTGSGIPPDDLPRVWERFYQVEKGRDRRERGGMGLGLAIVRGTVGLLEGTIDVESEPGTATIFTVRLPRCLAQRPEKPT